MNIVRVQKREPENKLLVHYAIHNICNYKCWYCLPNSNLGNYRWPDYKLAADHLIHLFEYYKEHLGKTEFELNLLGGEPTLWRSLGDFLSILKDKFGNNLKIMITTNGSRTVAWWEKYGDLFDKVLISCHPAYADTIHVAKVADLLYKKGKIIDTIVLMDPTRWINAERIVAGLMDSNYKWSIQVTPVIHDTVNYTKQQQVYLDDYMKRKPSIRQIIKNFISGDYKTVLHFSNGDRVSVSKHYLASNRLNHFKGWECDIGLENITVHFDGTIAGSCGQALYNSPITYNLYNKSFKEIFHPKLIPTVCSKDGCYCEHEINANKRIIPLKVLK